MPATRTGRVSRSTSASSSISKSSQCRSYTAKPSSSFTDDDDYQSDSHPTCARKSPPEEVTPGKSSRKAKFTLETIIINGIELKPTVVFDTFWRWCAERKAMDDRRRAGEPHPWTEDPHLNGWYFCMPYRVLDRGCQYLVREIIEKGSQEPREVVFRIVLYDIFTKIATWELLQDAFGELTWEDYDRKAYECVLESAEDALYTRAFIKPAGRHNTNKPNYCHHLDFLEKLMKEDRLLTKMRTASYLGDVYDFLREYRGMGEFTAYQLLLNLSYSGVMHFSNNDFVVPGLGCRSGLWKLFGNSLIKARTRDRGIDIAIIRWMAETQDEHFQRLGLSFSGLGPNRLPMDLADMEHSICEVDKYARVVHPSITHGRTAIKRLYKPSPARVLPQLVLPKAWSHPSRKIARIKPSSSRSRSSSLDTLTASEVPDKGSRASTHSRFTSLSPSTLAGSECEVTDLLMVEQDTDTNDDITEVVHVHSVGSSRISRYSTRSRSKSSLTALTASDCDPTDVLMQEPDAEVETTVLPKEVPHIVEDNRVTTRSRSKSSSLSALTTIADDVSMQDPEQGDADEITILSEEVVHIYECRCMVEHDQIQYLVQLVKPDGQERDTWMSKEDLYVTEGGEEALAEFGGEQYIIERIADVRDGEEGREFYVFWEGYGDDDATWEPEEMLRNDAPDALKKFLQRRRKTRR
ncbi:hypothetical protein V5O48_002606 [Marasmius crinis-equi]|uniref:Chromo domain-containing protein n=1 Tax=Marasmius crinis-equi TaxID=585013 RepID=A0ABR3FVI5_9AGAR